MKKMLKKTMTLMMMLIMVFALSTVASAKTKNPKLSKKTVTLEYGANVSLTLKNAKASKVKWSSTNKKVATVKKGKVTAKWNNTKKKGTCYIKAKYKGKTYKCKVTVKKATKLVNMWGSGVKNENTLKMLNELQSKFGDSNGKIKPSYVNSAKASAPIQVNYGGAKVEYPFGSDYRIAFPKAFKGLPGGYIELYQGGGDECSIKLRKASEPNGYYDMPIKKVTCSYPNFVACKTEAEYIATIKRGENREPFVRFDYDYGWGETLWISWGVPEGTVFTVSLETVNGITADYTVKVIKTPIII